MNRYHRLSPAGGAFFHSDGAQEDANQPTSVGVRMDTDLNSAISAFLSNCEDHQLYQLTGFYMKRLEQAIEEGVEGVGSMLMREDHFTGREYQSVTELAEKGNRAGASKLLLDLVMEKGSGARRVMWESFMKQHLLLPKLSRILNEIRERGDGQFAYMDIVCAFSETPTDLEAQGREEFLGPFPHETTCQVIDWVKEEVKRQSGNTWNEAGKRSLLNRLRYLFESQNREVALGSVKKLSFSGMTLTPFDCAVLDHVIGLCDTIKYLNLEGCHIRCEGIQRLGPGLHKCQELSLGRNELGDSGVKPVSAALRNPECKIQKLGLDNVGLTDSGAKDLISALRTNPSLTELDLGANKLGDSGVKPVSEALRNPECKIQKLGLDNVGLTDSGAKDLISALRTNPSLTELDLGANKLGDSGVKPVSEALRNPECKIQKLWLSDVGLTANGAKDLISTLSTNQSLKELSLNDNKLGDSGVKLVSAALKNPESNIQKLWLWNVGLTVSGAKDLSPAISTNRSLMELNLNDNQLGESGVKLVSAALRKAECKIQKLWLRDVGLTDSGVEQLASALSTNPSLMELNLNDNKLGDSGVKLVSEALRNSKCKIKKLWLRNVGLTDSGAQDLVSALRTNPSLTELNLSANKLGDSGVKLVSAALRNLECKIQKLWLYDVGLTANGAKEIISTLSTNRSLKELSLNDNKLEDSGVKLVSAALRISECKMQKLWLSDVGLTANGAKDLISTLSKSRSLKELSLSDNNLGDSGVKLVSAALRDSECKIQKLWLWNVGLTDSGAGDLNAALGGNPSLTVLNLNNNKLEDSGVKLVSAVLKKSRCKLQELGLRDVGLTDSGAEDLASALSTNRSLMELNLNDNKLGDSGVKLVTAALKKANCKIQKLWLRDVGLTNRGAEDLASALSSNPSLTELNLGANKLGDSGVKLVSEALRNPECKIQKLGLYDVGLTDSGAEDLASALSINRSLMELNLNDNKLGDSGVKLVTAALKKANCKIQKLWLRDVGLTDSGAEDLASALRSNPSLTELNLGANKLGDSGVKLVSAALKNLECKIQKLWLYDVSLTANGAKDLISTLSTNQSLTELSLNDNKLGDSGVKLVSEALRISECKIQKLSLSTRLWEIVFTVTGCLTLNINVISNCVTDKHWGFLPSSVSLCPSLSLSLISRLWSVGLTDSGAEDLDSALSSHPSLTELDLRWNRLTDGSVPALRRLILTHRSLERIGLGYNLFSETGKKELRSLREPRPGLTVTV
ncbi:uncharacterized protein [Mobula birostris]|uniref:uncharacterized protein isoform X2 n=1 Tax=Mobula birostris TaxID=1983395 RepID=UPI003B289314